MQFRHPASVIDETVTNLEYLTEFLIDDIDHGSVCTDEVPPCAMKAIAALEALRVLLPRLRVVRSNYVASSRFPDGPSGSDLLVSTQVDTDASEASTESGDTRIIR
jgi:hypothetical protein